MWLFYVTNFDLDDEAGIVTDIPFLFTKQLISNQLGKSSRVFFLKWKHSLVAVLQQSFLLCVKSEQFLSNTVSKKCPACFDE